MARLTVEQIENIKKRIEGNFIDYVKHPTEDLWILDYTRRCHLEDAYDEYTCLCRGMIIDKDWNIVERCMYKFFNYEEIEDKSIIPNIDFEVFEKLDGSMGTLYWLNDMPYIATRGSFASEQAIHATKLVQTKYIDICKNLDKSKTYVFEIIYPDNHIVVDYKDTDDIYLIAVIDKETGKDDNLQNYQNTGFNVVTRYDGVKDYNTIRDIFNGNNKEGFVVKFSNGFRMKMKFAEYFKIHALLNGISKKRIFEMYINNEHANIATVLNNVDEENRIMIEGWIKLFNNYYSIIYLDALKEYKEFDSDKEAAFYFKTCKWTPILFQMRKKKNIDQTIWKIIKQDIKDKIC